MPDSDRKHALFAELVAPLGKLVDRTELPLGSYLSEAYEIGEDIIRDVLPLRSPQNTRGIDIELGILNRGDFNAFAARTDDAFFIGLYRGMPDLVADAVLYMFTRVGGLHGWGVCRGRNPHDVLGAPFSDEDFFRTLAGILGERYQWTVQRRPILPLETTRKVAMTLSAFDMCPRRKKIAYFLYLECLQFIWRHELAHIRLGHVDHQMRTLGQRFLFELPDPSVDACPRRLSQFFEVQADRRAAIEATYGHFLRALPKLDEPGANSDDLSLVDCAAIAAAAPLVVACCAGLVTITSRKMHLGTHPTAKLRAASAVRSVMESLEMAAGALGWPPERLDSQADPHLRDFLCKFLWLADEFGQLGDGARFALSGVEDAEGETGREVQSLNSEFASLSMDLQKRDYLQNAI